MSPFVCPSNTFLVSSDTPAARKRLPNVCFRSWTLRFAKPHETGSPCAWACALAAAIRARFHAELYMLPTGRPRYVKTLDGCTPRWPISLGQWTRNSFCVMSILLPKTGSSKLNSRRRCDSLTRSEWHSQKSRIALVVKRLRMWLMS